MPYADLDYGEGDHQVRSHRAQQVLRIMQSHHACPMRWAVHSGNAVGQMLAGEDWVAAASLLTKHNELCPCEVAIYGSNGCEGMATSRARARAGARERPRPRAGQRRCWFCLHPPALAKKLALLVRPFQQAF